MTHRLRDTRERKGNSTLWHRLRKQMALEQAMLKQLIESHRPLLRKCAISPPDEIELSALAAAMHAFYNGVENIFKRVAVELGEAPLNGETWHRSLLDRMTKPAADRPAVISTGTAERLAGYLDFRHFFRNAYPFQLKWDRMSDLANGLEDTLAQLDSELGAFLKATADRA